MKLSVWGVNLHTVSMRRLLEWCLREHHVDRMLLAVRLKNKKYRGKWLSLVPGVPERTERLFGPYIREQFLAAAWPGTQLIRHPGLVYVLEFDDAVKDLMLETEPRLKRWLISRDPPLPEDICLFRMGDRHPIFVSVIHEEDAWLLTNKPPRLRGVSIEDGPTPDVFSFFFKGKFFCQKWREP